MSGTSGLSYTAALQHATLCLCRLLSHCFPHSSICSASFTSRCTSQLFIPPSRFCLPTRPNALNLRIAYKYDLSLSSLSSLCRSLSLSFTSTHSHTCIFTHSRTCTKRQRPQTHAHTHKHAGRWLFMQHSSSLILRCPTLLSLRRNGLFTLKFPLSENKAPLSAPTTQQQRIWKHDNTTKVSPSIPK